jgi:hypothetical protein
VVIVEVAGFFIGEVVARYRSKPLAAATH